MGVHGTPTIVLESGKLVGGYMPAAQLVERVRQDKKGL
jgi:protein-disulfide isomerase